jgi:hypothetical protein
VRQAIRRRRRRSSYWAGEASGIGLGLANRALAAAAGRAQVREPGTQSPHRHDMMFAPGAPRGPCDTSGQAMLAVQPGRESSGGDRPLQPLEDVTLNGECGLRSLLEAGGALQMR